MGCEVPHSLSYCTPSACKCTVCLVTACCNVKEPRDPPDVTDTHLSKAKCYVSHQQKNLVGQKLYGLITELFCKKIPKSNVKTRHWQYGVCTLRTRV